MTVFELQKKLTDLLYKGKAEFDTGIDAIELNNTAKLCKLIKLEDRAKVEKESVKRTDKLPFAKE